MATDKFIRCFVGINAILIVVVILYLFIVRGSTNQASPPGSYNIGNISGCMLRG